ncbi:branched-chain amino acid aminotransferase [Ornithinicoccus halotolerans]|uniref:branched-chain amino acid aminotransferase n=1 Tax=Ornithinicoccus halotolerans TaxID=1748220 RepID=UPI001294B305|nr:branched-chain amino acid aminotransferase [Ornithinicoccus halotolerans]
MSTQATTFAVEQRADRAPAERVAEVVANPAFGAVFTDHMALVDWDASHGWSNPRITGYGPLSLDPSAAVFHYGQEIFEGMKAYRHPDGTVWTFRPEANAARFARSAARLALPQLPEDLFLASLEALVRLDEAWVPPAGTGETSLYLRPFMIATEPFLGVRPSRQATYCLIASPAGAYFASGLKPVSIWLSEDYVRAAPGGTGAAKCGGNYAASLAPMTQGLEHGCEQVVFLDAIEHRWVEELGGMNLFFAYRDGTIVTPELTGTILEGVTRSSVIELARERGHEVVERRYSIDEWRQDAASGELVEVFACGTAAVITPVGRLVWTGGEVTTGDPGQAGEVAEGLRNALLEIQYGNAEDTHGWMHRLV